MNPRLLHLNELRRLRGKAPLKSWKESRAKLEDAIRKLGDLTEHDVFTRDNSSPADDAPVPVSAPQMSDEEFVKQLSKFERRRQRDAIPCDFTLASIARELSIEPSVARAKWRRLGNQAPSGKFSRYGFSNAQRNQVIALLTTGRKS